MDFAIRLVISFLLVYFLLWLVVNLVVFAEEPRLWIPIVISVATGIIFRVFFKICPWLGWVSLVLLLVSFSLVVYLRAKDDGTKFNFSYFSKDHYSWKQKTQDTIDDWIQSAANSSSILTDVKSSDVQSSLTVGEAKVVVNLKFGEGQNSSDLMSVSVARASDQQNVNSDSISAAISAKLEILESSPNNLNAKATVNRQEQQLVVAQEASNPLGIMPLQWFKVVTDEEAIAFWFLDKVAAQAEELKVSLTDEDETKLLQFLSLLIRFRLAGVDEGLSIDGDSDSIVPGSMARRFRWKMWWNGSEMAASILQFGIYYLTGLGIVTALTRREIVRRLIDPQPDQETKALQANYLTLSAFIDFTLPALGFIGTIYGLGSAFGAVGIISHIELTKEISLVEVLLNLATAFSTTFYALIGSVCVAIFSSWATAAEGKREDQEAEKRKEQQIEVVKLLRKLATPDLQPE